MLGAPNDRSKECEQWNIHRRLFQIEDSGASASHGCRIFARWRVGVVHRPKKWENSLALFPVNISIKLFHWRVIVNITVELKWTQLLLIAHFPLQQIFQCQGWHAETISFKMFHWRQTWTLSITIYKNNWTNKAHTASFDRLYFPAHFFQADGGKYELVSDHRF